MLSTSRSVIVLGLIVLGFATGCATMGRIANLDEPACGSAVSQAISTILRSQGEKPGTAATLADQAVKTMVLVNLGPRPFFVASPSGTDFIFFVQFKKSGCLLRLYGRQRGFLSYTNNLTYIATEPLPQCICSE